ncbi:MAG: DUF3110 domain-containing protein [Cyanothece sp. SIO1E1]|nr:DUF3110 domain-containing protein [Cyanothece sp. SIO1E1]
MHVFVLLFNARTENEGIHTLKVNGRNVVLMFEAEDDAIRYGLMLEAQDLPTPTVEVIDAAEIEEFCQTAGYEFKLVPDGTLEMPPETNVEKTDWDPDDKTQADPQAETKSESSSAKSMSAAELDRIRRQLEGLL